MKISLHFTTLLCAIFFMFSSTRLNAQLYATIPYTTGFESGSFDTHWTTTSSQAGINIDIFTAITSTTWGNAYPHTGTYMMGMHHAAGGPYNLNESWLHLDLNGATNLVFDFWWQEWNDETEAQDGIYISDNGGVTFTKILDLNGASYTDLTWQYFVIDLDSAYLANGLSLTSTCVIKFQQYDNYYFNGGNDGFFFDDINITGCIGTTAGYTSSNTGLTTDFSNTSTDTTSTYLWDFGDGNTSTQTNPQHTYANPGTYTVCLISTNSCDADTICQTITVCNPLTAGYTSSNSSLTVDFINTTTDTTSTYLWDFGDGNTSTQTNPQHTYASDGTYTICLISTNPCGSDTICDSVQVCATLNPSFTAAAGTSLGDYDFTYTGSSGTPTQYLWDFGDGNNATTMNPSHSYGSEGTFTVTLQVVNACGDTVSSTPQDVTIAYTGVIDNDWNDATVYPNPNDGNFTLGFSYPSSETLDVKLISTDGRVVYVNSSLVMNNSSQVQFNINGLSSGLYYLQLESNKGKLVKKLIVK